jgi:hypothetical protein
MMADGVGTMAIRVATGKKNQRSGAAGISCASPQPALCSGCFVIPYEVIGETLRKFDQDEPTFS